MLDLFCATLEFSPPGEHYYHLLHGMIFIMWIKAFFLSYLPYNNALFSGLVSLNDIHADTSSSAACGGYEVKWLLLD